jgi:hypothetical protein
MKTSRQGSRAFGGRAALLALLCTGGILGLLRSAEEDKDTDKESGKTTASGRPPFEKLLEWNGKQIFGGKVTVRGEDRFEVLFDAVGQMQGGFEGPGILDAESAGIQGANKKFIIKEKDVIHPGLACAGISQPNGVWSIWTSRFPVARDVQVQFDFRLPGLVNSQSAFWARVNVDGKNYLETSFFQTAEKHAYGKTLAKRDTPLKDYASHPMKWFPRAKPTGLPIEFGVEGDRFKVLISKKEVVGLDKVGDVAKGKISFGFRKIVFTMQNLKVSGKLDRAWCEEQLAQLEKAGKLVQKDPDAPPPDPLPPEGKKADGEGK